jgi:thiosulfate reductase cytochrome b subunit
MWVLLLSGLQILNAHPALYWGDTSTFSAPFAAIEAWYDDNAELRGRLRIGELQFDTTGVFGASAAPTGSMQARAMPHWMTLPSYLDLGAARAWHFFFAWLLVISGTVYVAHGLASGRLKHMLWPTRQELRGLSRSMLDHTRLRMIRQHTASYNVLQKLSYLLVLGVLAPVMILTGLAMSPAVDAVAPVIADLFGGRQSARSIHFFTMLALVAFVVMHLAMVILAGPLRELRTILTGWYRLDKQDPT